MSAASGYKPRLTKSRPEILRRTKVEIVRLREALYGILFEDNPMTVRQVFYQAVGRGLVAKTENEYKNTVGRLLLLMRKEGELPYEWISDTTRWMRKPRTFDSLQDALRNTAETYRRSLWAEAGTHVEVWTEKDALAGVLLEVTRKWDVPLMVSRGFSSETYLYTTAEAIKATGRPAHIYYFGDRDPSGVRIDPAIEKGLRRLAPDQDIRFERAAVLPEQIEEWHLPTRPTKTEGNTHARGFAGESVEVDAIPSAQLRRLVSDCIERHVDHQQLAVLAAAEKSEREVLEGFCRQLAGQELAAPCPPPAGSWQGLTEALRRTLNNYLAAHAADLEGAERAIHTLWMAVRAQLDDPAA